MSTGAKEGELLARNGQTTLQAKDQIEDQWTNFVTLTLWSSSSGNQELLVRNGAGQNIWTNYCWGDPHQPVATFTPAMLQTFTSPVKFMRAAIVQQP